MQSLAAEYERDGFVVGRKFLSLAVRQRRHALARMRRHTARQRQLQSSLSPASFSSWDCCSCVVAGVECYATACFFVAQKDRVATVLRFFVVPAALLALPGFFVPALLSESDLPAALDVAAVVVLVEPATAFSFCSYACFVDYYVCSTVCFELFDVCF